MYLTGIYLAGFGKYTDRHFEFSQGINILYGDNEKGKSTIHRFIETMLYDLNSYQFGLDIDESRYMQYKPWGKKEVFAGDMDFVDGDNHFHVERDFHNPKAIKVFLQGKRIGPYRQTPDNTVIKSHEHKMLRVLGITDISSKAGTDMLDEVQKRIMNIKATNSGAISYNDAIERIEKQIVHAQNDVEYVGLKSSYKHYQELLRDIEIKQTSHKNVTIEYLAHASKAVSVQKDIDKLNDQISRLQIVDQLKKSKRLHKINRELEQIQSKLDELKPYEDISVKDVEFYLRNKENQHNISEDLNQLHEKLEIINQEVIDNKGRFTDAELAFYGNSDRFESILGKVEALALLEQQLKTIDDDMEELMKEMLFLQPDYEENFDFQGEERLIDEHYQRFLNTSSWKRRIEEEKESITSVISLEEQMVNNENRLYNIKIASLIMQISGALLILTMFIKPTWAFGLFFTILALLIGILVLYFVKRNMEKEHIGLEFQLKNIHEEVRKTNSRLSKASEQLADIIESFGVRSENELVALYEEKKTDLRNRIDIKSNLNNNKARKETVEEKIETKLLDIQKDLDFVDEPFEVAEDIRSFLNNRMIAYDEYISKVSAEKAYQKSKVKMAAQLDDMERKLQEGEALSSITTLEQYQHYRDQLTKNQEIYRKLMSDKEELMEDQGFSPLDQSETDKIAISDFDNMEKELENLKKEKIDKMTYHDDLMLKCKRLAAESEHLEKLDEPYSFTLQTFEEIAEKLQTKDQVIDLYKGALELLKSGASKIKSRYTYSLLERLHDILHHVIGDKYEVTFDELLHLKIKDLSTSELVQTESLSQGTIDQIYFALRIGLIDAMADNINIPLILDDSFVHYDGGRLIQMLEQLAKLSRQIIILTCHHREKEIFDRLGITYNFIEL